jgi:hypothetical protein
VYFIVNVEMRCEIKIGISIHPEKRRSQVQTEVRSRRVDLLAKIPGCAELEGKLHKMFRSAKRHKEWFSPTDELLDYILTVAEPSPDLQKKIAAIREQRDWPLAVLWAASFLPLGEPIPSTRTGLLAVPEVRHSYFRDNVIAILLSHKREQANRSSRRTAAREVRS